MLWHEAGTMHQVGIFYFIRCVAVPSCSSAHYLEGKQKDVFRGSVHVDSMRECTISSAARRPDSCPVLLSSSPQKIKTGGFRTLAANSASS